MAQASEAETTTTIATPLLNFIPDEKHTVLVDNLGYWSGERHITGSATFKQGESQPELLFPEFSIATDLYQTASEGGSCNVWQHYKLTITVTMTSRMKVPSPIVHTLSLVIDNCRQVGRASGWDDNSSIVYFDNEVLQQYERGASTVVNEQVSDKITQWWTSEQVQYQDHVELKSVLKHLYSKLTTITHGNAFPFEMVAC